MGFNRKTGLPPGRISVQLIEKRPPGRPGFHIGEWGDSEVWVNLADVKFMLFPSRDRDGDMTLMIGDRERFND